MRTFRFSSTVNLDTWERGSQMMQLRDRKPVIRGRLVSVGRPEESLPPALPGQLPFGPVASLPIAPLFGLFFATTVFAAAWPSPATAAAQSSTIRQWHFVSSADGRGNDLALREAPRPEPGPGEVLVRVRATSLNRRDVLMLNGGYRSDAVQPRIPLSDGAGEVIGVGDGVTRFEVGDRVAGTFFEHWPGGERTPEANASARGGTPNGMLAEVVVSSAEGLVSIPDHLSYEEAATLPCAGLTAWVGLFKHGDLGPDDYVLLEGTGGVSSFGLLFAAAAGARPIITSSSDAKLERAVALGAFGTENYRRNPEWQETVRELTDGAGVDHVLEVGGRATLPKALQALGYGGHVALIGGLTGFGGSIPVGALMGIGASATGIYVGSRADFEAMNAFLSEHEIRPLVDRVFDFEEAPAAFEFMENGEYMGKIVIRHPRGADG